MEQRKPDDRVTIHVKVDRENRDGLVGALRVRQLTLQRFLENLMRHLRLHPEDIKKIYGIAADPTLDPLAQEWLDTYELRFAAELEQERLLRQYREDVLDPFHEERQHVLREQHQARLRSKQGTATGEAL